MLNTHNEQLQKALMHQQVNDPDYFSVSDMQSARRMEAIGSPIHKGDDGEDDGMGFDQVGINPNNEGFSSAVDSQEKRDAVGSMVFDDFNQH